VPALAGLIKAKNTLGDLAELCRLEVCRALDKKRRSALGQFLTPPHVAALMASMFKTVPATIELLDPGAGVGALTAAFVKEVLTRPHRPKVIRAYCFEIEPAFYPSLQRVLKACEHECNEHGVEFDAHSETADFLNVAVDHLIGANLFEPRSLPSFTHVILNPPYKKLSAESRERSKLRHVGVETSNYYAAFVWLSMLLLNPRGEMVSITPRSFCNGPYFKAFRAEFVREMFLRRLHVFESRSAAFAQDEVLQENVIVHSTKWQPGPSRASISSSGGAPGSKICTRHVAYCDVVQPEDPQRFIHLVVDDVQARAREMIKQLTAGLDQLGLSVSTGRVVDFRARPFLRQHPSHGTAPLIYPRHFNGGFVHWPKPSIRKPNALLMNDRTRTLLVPAGVYTLVRRFTAKEERRRVVACLYDPTKIDAAWVGFENHLNYYHRQGHGLPRCLAKGLSVFLNSTVLDVYFRLFSGHTQVNATDLRTLKYPERVALERLGKRIDDLEMTQESLDLLVERELF